MFTPLRRIIKSGWINFTRNKWLGIATVLILIMTISMTTSLFLLRGVLDSLVTSLQEKVDISVYIKPDVPEQDIMNLKETLERDPEVKDVAYISREEILQEFKERHQNDDVILQALEQVGDNPLLATINIKANQASQYEAITNFLETSSYREIIEKINYQESKNVIDKLFSIAGSINKTGATFSIILGFIAILVAFNTIRMAIYTMREEISVMRLVGASNWFIRGPFIIQGAIVGGIATIISFWLILVLALFLGPKLKVLIPDFSLLGYFIGNIALIFLIQLATGIGLGMLSSLIAIRRYLNT